MKPYDRKLLNADLESGRKLYLFFQSLGCGPCKLVVPSMENFASKRNDVYKINSNEGKDLAQYLRVTSYPTLVIVEDSQILNHLMGTNTILTYLNTYEFNATSNK